MYTSKTQKNRITVLSWAFRRGPSAQLRWVVRGWGCRIRVRRAGRGLQSWCVAEAVRIGHFEPWLMASFWILWGRRPIGTCGSRRHADSCHPSHNHPHSPPRPPTLQQGRKKWFFGLREETFRFTSRSGGEREGGSVRGRCCARAPGLVAGERFRVACDASTGRDGEGGGGRCERRRRGELLLGSFFLLLRLYCWVGLMPNVWMVWASSGPALRLSKPSFSLSLGL